MIASVKPRLFRAIDGLWRVRAWCCVGLGVTRWGLTMNEAYFNWSKEFKSEMGYLGHEDLRYL